MPKGAKGTGVIIEPSPFAQRPIKRRHIAGDIDATLAARVHAVSRATRLPIVALMEKAFEQLLPIFERMGGPPENAEDDDV